MENSNSIDVYVAFLHLALKRQYIIYLSGKNQIDKSAHILHYADDTALIVHANPPGKVTQKL